MEGRTTDLYDEHTSDIAFGCPVFAQCTAAERMRLVTKARICIYCFDADFVFKPGNNQNARHPNCIAWKRDCFFTCAADRCKKHFLICMDHTDLNKDKLQKCKNYWQIKGKTFTHFASQAVPNVPVSISDAAAADPEPAACVPEVVVTSVAEKLIDVAGEDTVVHDDIQGEPMFMFSYAVGKTRPVCVFYDDGCYRKTVIAEAQLC